MKYTYQLAHYIFALCIAKMISNGHTFPYHIDIGMDTDSTCRTDNPALAAANAVCFCDLLIKCRHYLCICSTVSKINGIDILHIVAHSYTVTAKDTFIRIPDNSMGTGVDRLLLSYIFKTDLMNTHAMSQFLQMTFSTLDTGSTISAVGR